MNPNIPPGEKVPTNSTVDQTEMTVNTALQPETETPAEERFDVTKITASGIREKILKGEPLSMADKIKAGRDTIYAGDLGNGIQTKPDHAYRAISAGALDHYIETGGVEIEKEGDVYKPGENNKGVDWYLGGFSPRYGDIVIETPATKGKFAVVESDSLLGKNPNVLHVKSEGGKNAIDIENITNVFRIKKSQDGKASFEPIDLSTYTEKFNEKARESDLDKADQILTNILNDSL